MYEIPKRRQQLTTKSRRQGIASVLFSSAGCPCASFKSLAGGGAPTKVAVLMGFREVPGAKKKLGYPVFEIVHLSDFIGYLETFLLAEFAVFRGQREDWPLLPKVARSGYGLTSRGSLPDVEQRMLNEFEREAASFLGSSPASKWDLLAIAQHHGLPTRLLDWTKNPLAALWFAVRHPAQDESHGVVWCFRPDPIDVIVDVATASSPFGGERTQVFEPRHVTSRIRAQDAVFTVHKYLTGRKKFIPLERNSRQKSKLEKFIISARRFHPLRIDLRRCGIHDASLFPDLGGLAQRIEYDYTDRAPHVIRLHKGRVLR